MKTCKVLVLRSGGDDMKLSKKVAIIFAATSVITIILYIISSNLMGKYLYKGEVQRITGISSGCINRVNGEISKVYGKGKEYSTLLKAVDVLNQNLNNDEGFSTLNLNNIFLRDGIDYKIIINSDMKVQKIYNSSDITEESLSDKEFLIDKVRELIKDGKTEIYGLIGGKNNPYIVAINKSISTNHGKEIYVATVEEFGQNTINKISKGMSKNIKIEKEITRDGEVTESELENGETVTLVTNEKNDEVSSYSSLKVISGDEQYYIKVTEPLVVRSSTVNNNKILSGILIIITIGVNLSLLLFMQKFVVRRIEKINKGINNVKENVNLEERLEEDTGNDEISILTRDINEMFSALELSNRLFIENEEKSSKLLEGLNDGYAYFSEVKDEEGNVVDANLVDANEAMARILDVPKEKLYRMTFKEIFSDKMDDKKFLQEIISSKKKEGIPLVRVCTHIGNDIWAYVTVYTIEGEHFAMIVTDVSENRKNTEEMSFLANYDVLTNLQNRYSLYKYMSKLKEEGQPFDIYFIDLDNFKSLNDSLGHNSGDEVLCKAAYTLEKLEYDDITVGRLGGDEFLVIKSGGATGEKSRKIGQDILESLNTTFNYKNYTYELKASVGMSSFPNHTDDIETLLKYADIAMYKSKQAGGNKIEIFDEYMLEEILIEAQLKKAIENTEFKIHYQPIYSIDKKKITGAEALVRWMKDGELIAPYKFIPIAKKTGDIYQIDNYVLREACKFCKEKRMNGFEDFQISVNASYRFLKQPDFVEMLKKVLNENELEPSGLKLEITEDEVLDDANGIVALLKKIKKIGVKVALDDFGVGYSSFSYVKILPIDTIKIDRSLLLKIEDDYKTVSIIKTLINLAHTLGLDVVAEGVEIEDQLSLLNELECDKIQGYYISKPVDECEFNNLLNRG